MTYKSNSKCSKQLKDAVSADTSSQGGLSATSECPRRNRRPTTRVYEILQWADTRKLPVDEWQEETGFESQGDIGNGNWAACWGAFRAVILSS